MRVNVARNLVGRQFPPLRQRQFGQQFGDIRPDQVPAENFAVLFIADDLHKADPLAQS